MMNALTMQSHNAALDGVVQEVSSLAPAPMALGKRQKAAIIVRLLLAEGVQISLQELPEPLQAELTRQISNMRFIDHITLKSVVDEFVAEIEDIGLSFPSGLEGALSVLDGVISATTAARIRKVSGVKPTGDPWISILGLPLEQLLPVLENESAEVAAVLMSKLKTADAAEVLGRLPGPRARQIVYAVSQTGSIAPETVERIGRSLAAQLDARPIGAFSDNPTDRVGAILNFSPASTREDVLEGLDQDDAKFAKDVRKTIFTFADIPDRLDALDVPRVIREVEQTDLITALAAATGDLHPAAEFLLTSLSKRMADQLREEVENLGKIKQKPGEAAMGQVIAAIRILESSGEITLRVEDEDDQEGEG